MAENDSDENPMLKGFNKLNIFRQIALMIGLAASVALGYSIIIWAQDGFYRPLINDLSVINASKAVDILELNDINYKVDVKKHILYVEVQSADLARLKLAKAGFDMEFPDQANKEASLAEKEESLLRKCGEIVDLENDEFKNIYFHLLLKELLALIALLALILGVLRPAVRDLAKKQS